MAHAFIDEHRERVKIGKDSKPRFTQLENLL
jgi:hypothetical protein